ARPRSSTRGERNVMVRRDPAGSPPQAPAVPADPAAVGAALTAYAHVLDKLIAGYHILDRNYTYDFHNELFLRHTPLVANYRRAGLSLVEQARQFRSDADAKGLVARASLPDGNPLAALLDDVRAYVAFMFDRSPTLERLSAEFERTPAGLQHAAHLYEGEAKYLATAVHGLSEKYKRPLEAPVLAPVTGDFKAAAQSIWEMYATHVVGF